MEGSKHSLSPLPPQVTASAAATHVNPRAAVTAHHGPGHVTQQRRNALAAVISNIDGVLGPDVWRPDHEVEVQDLDQLERINDDEGYHDHKHHGMEDENHHDEDTDEVDMKSKSNRKRRVIDQGRRGDHESPIPTSQKGSARVSLSGRPFEGSNSSWSAPGTPRRSMGLRVSPRGVPTGGVGLPQGLTDRYVRRETRIRQLREELNLLEHRREVGGGGGTYCVGVGNVVPSSAMPPIHTRSRSSLQGASALRTTFGGVTLPPAISDSNQALLAVQDAMTIESLIVERRIATEAFQQAVSMLERVAPDAAATLRSSYGILRDASPPASVSVSVSPSPSASPAPSPRERVVTNYPNRLLSSRKYDNIPRSEGCPERRTSDAEPGLDLSLQRGLGVRSTEGGGSGGGLAMEARRSSPGHDGSESMEASGARSSTGQHPPPDLLPPKAPSSTKRTNFNPNLNPDPHSNPTSTLRSTVRPQVPMLRLEGVGKSVTTDSIHATSFQEPRVRPGEVLDLRATSSAALYNVIGASTRTTSVANSRATSEASHGDGDGDGDSQLADGLAWVEVENDVFAVWVDLSVAERTWAPAWASKKLVRLKFGTKRFSPAQAKVYWQGQKAGICRKHGFVPAALVEKKAKQQAEQQAQGNETAGDSTMIPSLNPNPNPNPHPEVVETEELGKEALGKVPRGAVVVIDPMNGPGRSAARSLSSTSFTTDPVVTSTFSSPSRATRPSTTTDQDAMDTQPADPSGEQLHVASTKAVTVAPSETTAKNKTGTDTKSEIQTTRMMDWRARLAESRERRNAAAAAAAAAAASATAIVTPHGHGQSGI